MIGRIYTVMTEDGGRRKATVFIIFGLFFLWGFGWDTVGRRLWTDVNGVIVDSRDVPSTGAPRYATEYTVRSVDGKETVYWAGPTDGSLPRSMPVAVNGGQIYLLLIKRLYAIEIVCHEWDD
jgi:hypothetical protein